MEPAPRPRRFRWQYAAAATAVLALVTSFTWAAFSDQAAMETHFTTGTFGINLDGNEGNPINYEVAFSAENLDPGDSASATITINNSGTEDAYVYLASTTVTGGAEFAAALRGDVTASAVSAGSGALATLTTAGNEWLIPGGGSLPVTVTASLPADAGNAVQGQDVDVVFLFRAEQDDPTPSLEGPGPAGEPLESGAPLTPQAFWLPATYGPGVREQYFTDYGVYLGLDGGSAMLDLGPMALGLSGVPVAQWPAWAHDWTVTNVDRSVSPMIMEGPDVNGFAVVYGDPGTTTVTWDLFNAGSGETRSYSTIVTINAAGF